MHVTRLHAAPSHHAPKHSGMRCRRLQGRQARPAEPRWPGLSMIDPGGDTGLEPAPIEQHQGVIAGELGLPGRRAGQAGPERALLHAGEPCRCGPGQARRRVDHSQQPAPRLLALPFDPPAPATSPTGATNAPNATNATSPAGATSATSATSAAGAAAP